MPDAFAAAGVVETATVAGTAIQKEGVNR